MCYSGRKRRDFPGNDQQRKTAEKIQLPWQENSGSRVKRACHRGERHILDKENIRIRTLNCLRTIRALFLEALYPSRCPVCNRILSDRKLRICPVCSGSLHLIEEHYCLKCGKPLPETEEYCADCKGRKREFCQGRGVFLYNMQMKNSNITAAGNMAGTMQRKYTDMSELR